jgi:hypothetical protein
MDTELNWNAVSKRAKQVIEGLRGYYGQHHWTADDEKAAARMLAYCRSQAAGKRCNTTTEAAMMRFLWDHNQSLDWVFRGDLTTMITDLAASSPHRAKVVKNLPAP